MFEKYKKEAPFFTGITRGVGGAGFGKAAAAVSASSISASGGTKIPAATTGNGYTYHVFTSGTSSFQVQSAPSPFSVSFIVVGGGGGGGWDVGGGGGGGGIAYSASYPLPSTPATYPVTVGSAGPGATNGQGTSGNTPNGEDSSLTIGANVITGKGGGSGGNYNGGSGQTGGSGGGASGYVSPGSPGPASQPSQPTYGGLVLNYGQAGGPAGGSGPDRTGGGGGGSGGAGSAGISNINGSTPGGPAQPFVIFAGPIIAPAIPAPSVPVIGPTGLYSAGGAGKGDSAPYSTSPLPGNTGYGGDGAGGPPGAGQPGSTGIVIIRYADSSSTPNRYRYWRLYKTNGATGGDWHNEVQWTEQGSGSYYQGTNYQNWTGSGLNSFTAANVTNGNTSQNAFHTDTAGVGATATLDLGGGNEKYFNKVEIWLSGTTAVAIWNIQASNDGTNWTTLYSGLNVYGYTNISATW